MQLELENYTFLTSEIVLRVLNVFADPKEQILKGFSNIVEFSVFFHRHARFRTQRSDKKAKHA